MTISELLCVCTETLVFLNGTSYQCPDIYLYASYAHGYFYRCYLLYLFELHFCYIINNDAKVWQIQLCSFLKQARHVSFQNLVIKYIRGYPCKQ